MTVRILCDSTADLDQAYRDAHAISVVPLKVIFGEQVFVDGVDLSPAEFYARLRASEVFPRTSQPTPAEFEAAFRSATDGGDSAVCTTISSDLSGTFASAEAARAALSDRDIRVVDTRNVGPGHNSLVRVAVAAAMSGADADAVVAAVESVRRSMQVRFVVDTLEYLRRGGRIGGARALVGSMLNIKPILEIRDGRVEAGDRVRTLPRALDRIVAECAAAAQAWDGAVITIADAAAQSVADELTTRLAPYAIGGVARIPVGPVIGAHAGPGTAGVAYHPRSDSPG